MSRSALLGGAFSCLALPWLAAAGPAAAQEAGPLKPVTAGRGSVMIPSSSQPARGGGPRQMHTHSLRFVPTGTIHPDQSNGTFYETPASLACVYRQGPMPYGCIPGAVTAVAKGGSRTIAIVDAYDHPNIASDLARFSAAFGLPAPNFQVVFASGTRPAQDPTGGWEFEEALDVEMAHALAPNARIVLVEAASPSDDLYTAVDVASDIVAQAGGGEVSMSWGANEFSSESYYDTHFQKPGVVYFASTGDNPGTEYPSASPYVVAVGGTSIRRNPTTGVLYGQATWDQGGGGASPYIASPAYQAGVRSQTGAMRAVPDIAAEANPYTGVLVYDSLPVDGYSGGWLIAGGTSVAAPIVAALTNASGTFQASSVAELTQLYANAGSNKFRPIQKGSCGPGEGYGAALPWSPCVGLGSPARPQPF